MNTISRMTATTGCAPMCDFSVELDGTSLAVADDARFLIRSVAAAFDARLDASKQLHRRAVYAAGRMPARTAIRAL